MLASRVLPSLLLFKAIAMLASSILYNVRDYNYFTGHDRMAEEDTPLLQNILLRQQQKNANSQRSNDFWGGGEGVHYNHAEHNHTIPNVLVFTHYKNLLDLDLSQNLVDATRKASNEEEEEDTELRALQANIRATIALHPNATTRFLTDADCETSIRNALGRDTKLVEYFRAESHGMYKSDICRGAALWETGGLYFDVDLGARMSLWAAVGKYTSFVTVKVPVHSKQRPGFFQAFMGSTPRHPLLQRYLELFARYYEGNLLLKTKVLPNPDKHMLGVRILRIAYDQLKKEEEMATASYQPIKPEDRVMPPATTTTATSASSNNLGIVELWQETLYSPREFPLIPKPTWGLENKSCRYVVVANDGLWPPLVPFYSRIAGSRMCPAA